MVTTLGSGKVSGTVNLPLKSTLDLVTANAPLNKVFQAAFTDGAGANQLQDVFSDQRTLANGALEDLDLAGSLVNAYGETIIFTAIKVIAISNDSDDNILELGGAAANGFLNWVGDATDKIRIPAKGFMVLVNPTAGGYAVTAGTGDLLRVKDDGSASGTLLYSIILGGIL